MEFAVRAMTANLTLEDHLLWSREPCPLQNGCWTWSTAILAEAQGRPCQFRSGKSVLFKGELCHFCTTSGTKRNCKTCFQTLAMFCANGKSVPNSPEVALKSPQGQCFHCLGIWPTNAAPVEASNRWVETQVFTCQSGAQRSGCPRTSSQHQSHDPYSWWPQEPHTQECHRTSKSSYLVRSFWQSQNQSENTK